MTSQARTKCNDVGGDISSKVQIGNLYKDLIARLIVSLSRTSKIVTICKSFLKDVLWQSPKGKRVVTH